jgi:hypothetical protein
MERMSREEPLLQGADRRVTMILKVWSKETDAALSFDLLIAENEEGVAIDMQRRLAEALVIAEQMAKADKVVTPTEQKQLDAISAAIAAYGRRAAAAAAAVVATTAEITKRQAAAPKAA